MLHCNTVACDFNHAPNIKGTASKDTFGYDQTEIGKRGVGIIVVDSPTLGYFAATINQLKGKVTMMFITHAIHHYTQHKPEWLKLKDKLDQWVVTGIQQLNRDLGVKQTTSRAGQSSQRTTLSAMTRAQSVKGADK